MSETEQGNNGTGPNTQTEGQGSAQTEGQGSAQTEGQGGGMDFKPDVTSTGSCDLNQQVREARKNFEAMPPFVQHSLFFQEPESIEPRSLPFAPRLEKATALKDAGNVAFKNKDYRGAVERYERALGCFTWFTSTDPDWKTNGIKDENLRLDRFGGESDEEKAEIQKFEVSCLNNMAAAFLQVKQWDMCGALCSDVIRRDPENATARHRRAIALSSRPQSGEKELEMAISDLGVALKADPEDKKVNALRSKLLKQKDDNKTKEKDTLSGVFNRGEIVVENEKPRQQKLLREAREKFEAMPPFIQHSLFFQEPESIEPRSLPFAPRLEQATALKDAGNVAFKNKDYRGAVERYERALGCFTWFTSTDPDWKTNGIKDENLRLDRFGGESDEEKAEIQKFEVSCLNNMAAAFLQVKQWDMCGALCSDVIRRDPENAKARHRRAIALSSRPQSGEKELEMAISDLGVALKADPEDKKVNALRSKLLKQKDDNKTKEKDTLSGVFNRGEIVVENEKPRQQKLLREAREKFEAMPPFIQHSLFFQEPESIEPRSLPFAPRLEQATALKDAGNVAFKNKDYRGAVERYERALGCFTWFTSTDPDWKTNGIKDENLRLDRFGGESDEEKAEIQKFEVSCLNNMAAAFLQVKQWDMCGALCSDVIRRDPENAKARHRRAIALSSRPQSGEKELEMAISDLGVALKADPEDKKVNALRSKLLKQKDDNKTKEKDTLSGVFNRGEIVVENEKPQQQKLLTPEEIAAKIDKSKSVVLQQFDFLEAMMKQAHAAGKKEEALNLAQHIKARKDAQVNLVKQEELGPGRPDYRTPTPEMIREAAQFDLDLKYPRIVLELKRLEQAKISENGEVTEILAKEDADFLATAQAGEQPWFRKNRLAVGVLMVVIALIVFVLMSFSFTSS